MEKDLLVRAAHEITDLRWKNELMSARLEMFDSMMLLLHTQPAHKGQVMSPDLVFEIEKYIAEKNETR